MSRPNLCSPNLLRADWLYQRLPDGDAILALGKGLSPAFFNLLLAVGSEGTVSFEMLSRTFPHQDADDLELWLAELCQMRLIAPTANPRLPAGGRVISAAPGQFESQSIAVPHVSLDLTATSRRRVLLVHQLPAARLAWRKLLDFLPVELIDAQSMEEAEAAYNQQGPHVVILGTGRSNFDTLNLVHALKHPRASYVVKLFLMLDEPSVGQKMKEASACADETVEAADWNSLTRRMAFQLDLPVARRGNTTLPVPDLHCNPAPGSLHPVLAAVAHDRRRDDRRILQVLQQWSTDALQAQWCAIDAELHARED